MTVSTSGLQRLQKAWGCCVSAAFGEMTRLACARTQPGLCRTAARGCATLLRFALTLYYLAFWRQPFTHIQDHLTRVIVKLDVYDQGHFLGLI